MAMLFLTPTSAPEPVTFEFIVAVMTRGPFSNMRTNTARKAGLELSFLPEGLGVFGSRKMNNHHQTNKNPDCNYTGPLNLTPN